METRLRSCFRWSMHLSVRLRNRKTNEANVPMWDQFWKLLGRIFHELTQYSGVSKATFVTKKIIFKTAELLVLNVTKTKEKLQNKCVFLSNRPSVFQVSLSCWSAFSLVSTRFSWLVSCGNRRLFVCTHFESCARFLESSSKKLDRGGEITRKMFVKINLRKWISWKISSNFYNFKKRKRHCFQRRIGPSIVREPRVDPWSSRHRHPHSMSAPFRLGHPHCYQMVRPLSSYHF